MSWIKLIHEDDADGILKEAYEDIGNKRGGVANVIKAHSVNPKVMVRHMELYLSLMFSKSPLSRREREMIATVVSTANKCQYCKTHHGKSLSRVTRNEVLTEVLKVNWRNAELTQRESVICRFVEKLAQTPAEMTEDDIAVLRLAGFEDRGIHDIVAVTSYFCFVNRMVLGLGIEIEANYEQTC